MLEKEMATHSSILAWRIPRTEEPGVLLSMELQSWTRLKRLSSSSSSIDAMHRVCEQLFCISSEIVDVTLFMQ